MRVDVFGGRDERVARDVRHHLRSRPARAQERARDARAAHRQRDEAAPARHQVPGGTRPVLVPGERQVAVRSVREPAQLGLVVVAQRLLHVGRVQRREHDSRPQPTRVSPQREQRLDLAGALAGPGRLRSAGCARRSAPRPCRVPRRRARRSCCRPGTPRPPGPRPRRASPTRSSRAATSGRSSTSGGGRAGAGPAPRDRRGRRCPRPASGNPCTRCWRRGRAGATGAGGARLRTRARRTRRAPAT